MKGNCADFPTAPMNTKTPARVSKPSFISETPFIISFILNEPTWKNIIIIPINIPISPTLLVKNALLAANGGFSFSNQNLSIRNELSPTSSQKTYIMIKESARTIPFIENIKMP